MTQTSQRTYTAKPGTLADTWYLVDARGQTLGRLAVNIARVLRGKHRPQFTPHLNTGEHVVVINARDIVVTGRKRTLKVYDRYSGYPERPPRAHLRASRWSATRPTRSCTRCAACSSTTPSARTCSSGCASTPAPSTSTPPSSPQPISFGELGEIKVASS